MTALLTVTKRDSLDDQLKRFLELDVIGIVNDHEHQGTTEEEDAVNQFNSSCHLIVSDMKLVSR